MKNKLFLSLSLLTSAFIGASPSSQIINAMNLQEAKEAYAKQVAASDAAYLAKNGTRLERAKNAVNQVGTSVVAAGTYLADTRAGKALVTAGSFTKDKAVIAGSFVKANTYDRSLFGYKNGGKYATAGAGLITVAGLGYLAYKKFGKAKPVQAVKIAAPVKSGKTPRTAADRRARRNQ